MKLKNYFLLLGIAILSFTGTAQEIVVPNVEQGPSYIGTFESMIHVPSIASRMNEIVPDANIPGEAQDKRSLTPKVLIGKDPQTFDDYLASNPDPTSQSIRVTPPILVFDGFSSNSIPTDPDMAVGPNHVFVTWNTAFAIYDKSGNQLLGPTSPNPAIFPNSGCCDLTVTYDKVADRWVLTFLFAGGNQNIAVSDGPDPINDGWYIYAQSFNDYQKLSIWSDGYYVSQNNQGADKVFALERDEMLLGNPAAQIAGFNLPGIAGTTPFFAPQFFNVADDNMPAAGGATVVFLQDDAFGGIANDHVKYWTVDMDWVIIGNSTISAATEIAAAPFISIFDGGSFVNLQQPGGGTSVDAVQNTVMNQAQFRKFGGHNSAVFNFVVDTDGGAGELAGIRWYEFRQTADNMPWTLYQEGTYTSPDGKHAWMASIAMDGAGNIAMGYTGMAGPSTPNPTDFRISPYYTGRFDGDALGTMTVAEELISAGNANIPTTRYCDYNSLNVDPSDDATFWFIDEYMNNGRKGVVAAFLLTPNTTTDDIGVTSIDEPNDGVLTANEDVTISIRNFGINDITDPDVQYDIDGGTPVVEMYSGTISAGTTVPFTFAQQADLSVPGTYTINSETLLGGDTVPANNAATKDVTNGALYCIPVADCSSFNDGVTMLELADQDIAVTCGPNGYNDDTGIVFNFDTDTNPFNGVLQMGWADSEFAIWIDFDDSGSFEADELIANDLVPNPDTDFPFVVDFATIPATTNGMHRMRVRGEDESGAGVVTNPCDDLQWGRTNDYTANVFGTLGIEDLSIAEADLIVLSKPNDMYEISLVTAFDGVASIAVFNVLGQQLAFNNLEKEGNAYNYSLDMSYAAAGVYLVKIGDQSSNTFKTARIVVK